MPNKQKLPPKSLLKAIRNHNRLLLTTHRNPDGDAVGSCLALALALKAQGKVALVAVKSPFPEMYGFLPGRELFHDESILGTEPWEIILCLDAADSERLTISWEAIKPKPLVLNIDHHGSNTLFGDGNWVDAQAASTGTMVVRLLNALGWAVDKDMAINLYTALITDTGNFEYSNTDGESFSIAEQLLATGIEAHKISENIFHSVPPRRLKLHGCAFQRLQSEFEGELIWTWLEQKDFDESEALAEDTEGISDALQTLQGMRMALFFRQKLDGNIKVSFRSKEEYDVKALAQTWGGGGHERASGCDINNLSLEEALQMVLEQARELILLRKKPSK